MVTEPVALVAGRRCDAPWRAQRARTQRQRRGRTHAPFAEEPPNSCSSASLCAPAKFGRRGAGSTSREGQLRSSGTAGRLTPSGAAIAKVPTLIHRVTISPALTLADQRPRKNKIQNQRLFHPRRSFSAAQLEPFGDILQLNSAQLQPFVRSVAGRE